MPEILSSDAITTIIRRAATLDERCQLAVNLLRTRASQPEEKIENRLETWAQRAAKGDRAQFAKRLEWENLTLELARAALADDPEFDHIPDWAATLQAVEKASSEAQSGQAPAGLPRYCQTGQPVPFQEILLPFVEVARQKLAEVTGPEYDLFSEQAQIQLERHLLTTLSQLSAYTLLLDFNVYRSRRQLSALFGPPPAPQNPASRRHYDGYIRQMLDGGLMQFFMEYSVLARLMCTALDFWVNSTAELVNRLAQDRLEIEAGFGGQKPAGRVVEAVRGLSDRHNGGRGVVKLTFESGLQLIYKPRSVQLEVAYNQFLGRLNELDPPLPLMTVNVLSQDGYGWMEFVPHRPCDDTASIKRFYFRLGMLLNILNLLSATDCHYENFVACGEQPVLIDAETILHPVLPELPAGEDPEIKQSLAFQTMLDNSVLRTGLLPFHAGHQEQDYNYSAFATTGEFETPHQIYEWQAVNTDQMRSELKPVKILHCLNSPFPPEVKPEAQAYAADLTAGFVAIGHKLIEHRQTWLKPDGPLNLFQDTPARFLFRSTQIYGSLQDKMTGSKFMRHGLDRSFEIEALSRAYLIEPARPVYWPLFRAEREAMEQGDIPMFCVATTSARLYLPGGRVIENWFKLPAYRQVELNLKTLDEKGLLRQLAIIEAALADYFNPQMNSDPWWAPLI